MVFMTGDSIGEIYRDSFRIRQVVASLSVCPRRLSCAHMKNIYNTAQKRSFRKWVRQLFSSWIKYHNCNCQQELEKVIAKLQEIEDSIEIMARQMARQIKSRE